MPQITIVMYHYVRELTLTRYPRIKGLNVTEFKKQLDYFEKFYSFVTMEECLDSLYTEDASLPDNALLLTFDDGYIEHFNEVFPILDERGIQGSFFPPVQAILESKVLDVNKIHFVLATHDDLQKLLDDVLLLLKKYAFEYELETPEFYLKKLAKANRYDSKETVFIKRLLQRELEDLPRKLILDELFKKYVSDHEESFARELYMNRDQLKCLVRNGMFIGGHGYSHKWLNALSTDEQHTEVQLTRKFLDEVGMDTNQWVMCYPFGAWNESLVDILKEHDCALGLATEVGIAELAPAKNAYTLKRLDTNDFPKEETDHPNKWTALVQGKTGSTA